MNIIQLFSVEEHGHGLASFATNLFHGSLQDVDVVDPPACTKLPQLLPSWLALLHAGDMGQQLLNND